MQPPSLNKGVRQHKQAWLQRFIAGIRTMPLHFRLGLAVALLCSGRMSPAAPKGDEALIQLLQTRNCTEYLLSGSISFTPSSKTPTLKEPNFNAPI